MFGKSIGMVRVKICGNTDAEQIQMCADAGADCFGFVVEYPIAVPWNLSREEAKTLLPLVPPFVSHAVVTGGSVDQVLAIADYLHPHVLQLHTDNTVAETAVLAKELDSRGIRLIRALRINVATGEASGEVADPLEAALRLQETGIAALLIDARTDSMPAGTGVSVSWETARSIREAISVPLILAGGLNPSNVRDAVEIVCPYAVDVITGVESSRRVKDRRLVQEFVRQAKQFSSFTAT
jgi:phosphoribosylanthranilate isomerase